jgi:hypothetical protein
MKETRAVLNQLKPWKRILVEGVLQWGWTCFLGSTLFDYLSYRYWGEGNRMLSTQRLLASLLMWSLAGIFLSWMQRRSSQGLARYKKPDSLIR